jgi:hypothetical protein
MHSLLLISIHHHHSSVNKLVPRGKALQEALNWAAVLVEKSSLDAIQSTKRGLLLATQFGDVEEATVKHALSRESVRHFDGENIKVRFLYLEY